MRMLVKRLSLALLIVMGSSQTHAAEKLKIIASFSILADITKAITGDAVDVTSLVEPEADLHHFEPRPHDIKRLLEADLVIVNGLGFEPWLDRVKPKAKKTPFGRLLPMVYYGFPLTIMIIQTIVQARPKRLIPMHGRM